MSKEATMKPKTRAVKENCNGWAAKHREWGYVVFVSLYKKHVEDLVKNTKMLGIVIVPVEIRECRRGSAK